MEPYKERILACVAQALVNSTNDGEDNAMAAMDLLCAFILIASDHGSDPDEALNITWTAAKGLVREIKGSAEAKH